MRFRFAVCLLFASLPLCTLRPASATPTPGAQKPAKAAPATSRADELFAQATAAFEAGRPYEAETKFEEAWALKQSYDIAANLGFVKARLTKHREAVERFAWAIEHLPPEAASMRPALEEELQKERAEVAALRIRVNVEGAEVAVNGRAVGSSPVASEVFVDPGAVTVTARRDGYEPATEHGLVTKGSSQDVTVVLKVVGAAKSTPVKPAPPPPKTKPRSILPGLVLAGAGGAALVTGIALLVNGGAKGASARALHDAIQGDGHDCVTGFVNYDSRCPELRSAAVAGDTRHGVGVAFTVLGVAAGVAAAGYFLWPKVTTRATRPRAQSLVPVASTTSAGLLFSGAF
jgi:hypothetical protein